jgi:hypothetical protein
MKTINFSLWLLLLLHQTGLFAETVYKGTDASGNIIYSDQPLKNGKPIELAPIPTFTPPPLPTQAQVPVEPKKQGVTEYKISILQPGDRQTFTNDIQTIDVKLSIAPTLDTSDQIRIILNDQVYGIFKSDSPIQIKDLARGSYRLKAEIPSQNSQDPPKGQSATIIFYQQRAIDRATVGPNLAPQAPIAPRGP